jgi:hypothetical protein
MTGDEEMIIHKKYLETFFFISTRSKSRSKNFFFIKRMGMRGNEDKCENNLSRNSPAFNYLN